MKKITYILPLFVAAFLFSCGDAETETPATEETTTEESADKGGAPAPEAANVYSIDPATAVVKWTGFKTPEKIGVDGEFKTYTLTGYTDNASSISEMMTGTEIVVDVTSTKTGDEARDGKIVNSFFGSMMNTENIVATLVNMDGDTEGTAQVEITMNEVTFIQDMEWTYREDLSMFILQSSINVPDWNAQAALDQLTEVCFEKHQGITWSDVEVRANVKVISSPAAGV